MAAPAFEVRAMQGDPDWSFFMPDTAIEKTPLEQAVDAVEEVLNKQTTVECVQVVVSGSDTEFALTIEIEDTSDDMVRNEVARALIDAGEKLLRADAYAEGIKQGKHLAALKHAS